MDGLLGKQKLQLHPQAPVGPEVRFLPQTVFTIVTRKRLRLTDERHDSARDQVPVLIERKRPDWLDIENVLSLFLGPEIKKWITPWSARVN